MDEREKLCTELEDTNLMDYFYLKLDVLQLMEKLDSIKLTLSQKNDDAPFNAQVKGYLSATDEENHLWIVKPCVDPKEILYHRVCTLVYLLDHYTGTLSAPTMLTKINDKFYRVTKVINHAMQISSYNYLEQPFVDILRSDLINRWIYFDEDRNPNNYLVIENKKKKLFLVSIDFDKADLTSTKMKITGDPEKFGWFRSEKTRFLTLLRPNHFEAVPIEIFDARLKAFSGLPEKTLMQLCKTLCTTYDDSLTETLASNIKTRIAYVDEYFRKSFKPANQTVSIGHEDDYSAFGNSFIKMHGSKN